MPVMRLFVLSPSGSSWSVGVEELRCNSNRALTLNDGLPLAISLRQANEADDVPFTIVKVTSEIHRARLRFEERLAQTQAELALVSDDVAEQMLKIGFLDRRIAGDRSKSTGVRYEVAELQNRLRGSFVSTT
ncbi:hypothetical protein C8Q73DRAFT_669611 [Cubamyces lactineus]|nr:hypothetical protein C8Q73DRAFT_669611 [Cubamyces lactineus]